MKKVLRRGFTNRKIGVNDKHDKSSRSHCIFTLIVSSGTQTGILNLVDLAGSEYASGEGNIGETRHINQSLLSLKKVLKAKVDKRQHVPYLESVLTKILKSSLGGYSKTLMIATVSPSAIDLIPTLSTLKYAQLANRIQNNPLVNIVDPKDKEIQVLTIVYNELFKQNIGVGNSQK